MTTLASVIQVVDKVTREHGILLNRLVNGFMDLPEFATADLPAADATQNGRLVWELAGGDDKNLVVYKNGQRFRFDGGSPF
jgi:hypothetical protein